MPGHQNYNGSTRINKGFKCHGATGHLAVSSKLDLVRSYMIIEPGYKAAFENPLTLNPNFSNISTSKEEYKRNQRLHIMQVAKFETLTRGDQASFYRPSCVTSLLTRLFLTQNLFKLHPCFTAKCFAYFGIYLLQRRIFRFSGIPAGNQISRAAFLYSRFQKMLDPGRGNRLRYSERVLHLFYILSLVQRRLHFLSLFVDHLILQFYNLLNLSIPAIPLELAIAPLGYHYSNV